MTLSLKKLDTGDTVIKLMQPFYTRLVQDAYRDADALLDAGVSFDLANDAIQGLLKDLAKNVKGITDTTRDDIQTLVGRQADEGWSMEQLAQAIREAGVTQSVSRSTTIARTETATAYSRGSLVAYTESGVVKEVEWLTSEDACPICDPLDGLTAALGDTFPGDIGYPPAHPNCTCAISPVVR